MRSKDVVLERPAAYVDEGTTRSKRLGAEPYTRRPSERQRSIEFRLEPLRGPTHPLL